MTAPADGPGAPGGALVIAATPIGNTADASPRLVRALEEADLVAAEDTRRLHRLCQALGVTPRGRVVSCYEHNEEARAAEVVEAVTAGLTVLLVSDAGMPAVSDPGYRLVRACVEHDLRVTVLPGPSAVLSALALSGLPTDRFTFEGFPRRKAGERARALAALRDEQRTMVFFESPHRTAGTLAAMAQVFGDDRPAALCRELTKTYEEVRRGPLGVLAAGVAQDEVRGEVCLVVAGRPPRALGEDEVAAAVEEVVQRSRSGERLKDAAAAVAVDTGLGKKLLYDRAIAADARRRP
ncbi:16S rRNA (cytidine(1402)-2'-O)-methyltransferase [Kineococcus auxinigenes]|uniref:16S rRNA (cytidine(1402)-2'-O)-methyltransferase n=1 Tax=unclassified Kineococcus TaxID=2621656 RepID=UPI003D7ED176